MAERDLQGSGILGLGTADSGRAHASYTHAHTPAEEGMHADKKDRTVQQIQQQQQSVSQQKFPRPRHLQMTVRKGDEEGHVRPRDRDQGCECRVVGFGKMAMKKSRIIA